MKFFSKKGANAKCYVFYSFDFDRAKTKDLFEYLLIFFSELNIAFEQMSYYDERYKINYGKFDKIRTKIDGSKWEELVHLGFYDKDVRDPKRRLGVEFNITRPEMITVVLAEGINIDVKRFCNGLYNHFKILYGFSYSVEINEWAAAYANGDWQHSDGAHNIKRRSKDHLQRWSKNCELIKDGFIRDVYQENILSKAHLGRLVNNMSLEEYIRANKNGEIETINSEIFIWTIADDNKSDEIRSYLVAQGVVI